MVHDVETIIRKLERDIALSRYVMLLLVVLVVALAGAAYLYLPGYVREIAIDAARQVVPRESNLQALQGPRTRSRLESKDTVKDSALSTTQSNTYLSMTPKHFEEKTISDTTSVQLTIPSSIELKSLTIEYFGSATVSSRQLMLVRINNRQTDYSNFHTISSESGQAPDKYTPGKVASGFVLFQAENQRAGVNAQVTLLRQDARNSYSANGTISVSHMQANEPAQPLVHSMEGTVPVPDTLQALELLLLPEDKTSAPGKFNGIIRVYGY